MTRTRGKNGDKKATQINIFRVLGLPIKVSTTKFLGSFISQLLDKVPSSTYCFHTYESNFKTII